MSMALSTSYFFPFILYYSFNYLFAHTGTLLQEICDYTTADLKYMLLCNTRRILVTVFEIKLKYYRTVSRRDASSANKCTNTFGEQQFNFPTVDLDVSSQGCEEMQPIVSLIYLFGELNSLNYLPRGGDCFDISWCLFYDLVYL